MRHGACYGGCGSPPGVLRCRAPDASSPALKVPMLGASTRFVSAGREVPMDRRRVLLSIAGFGVAVVISTPGIAGDDLCKPPRLGVTPSLCATKSTDAADPDCTAA